MRWSCGILSNRPAALIIRLLAIGGAVARLFQNLSASPSGHKPVAMNFFRQPRNSSNDRCPVSGGDRRRLRPRQSWIIYLSVYRANLSKRPVPKARHTRIFRCGGNPVKQILGFQIVQISGTRVAFLSDRRALSFVSAIQISLQSVLSPAVPARRLRSKLTNLRGCTSSKISTAHFAANRVNYQGRRRAVAKRNVEILLRCANFGSDKRRHQP